jgi:hypothetical protein
MHHDGRQFVPRTLPAAPPLRSSQAARDREAKAYWDSLTPEQEAWVLRKMNFASFGTLGGSQR